MADIGWITGHSYIVYGPLALGATSVLYEGVPQFPDAGRPWRIAERLDVNIFHTSPTAIRMLRKAGPRRAEEVQLPLQAHDHRRRAHRAGRVALVSRGGRQGRSRHRRHLVANGNRRLPVHHQAGARSDEARQRRTGLPGNLSGHLGRRRQGSHRGLRTTPATSASAIRGQESCRRSGAIRSAS